MKPRERGLGMHSHSRSDSLRGSLRVYYSDWRSNYSKVTLRLTEKLRDCYLVTVNWKERLTHSLKAIQIAMANSKGWLTETDSNWEKMIRMRKRCHSGCYSRTNSVKRWAKRMAIDWGYG